ncbi:MAG: large conductance mechanosensitive channel protein MscL [Planctomycetes bacterium]|nr:large conductance mechanosensitive channel protein MscL [Planctomycetota bacterium]
MKIIQEFKDFALKGNAMDLAVGVIIGAAFGKIVNSLVQDMINPVIGMLIGGVDLSNWKIVLKRGVEANPAANIAAVPDVAIKLGAFLNMCIEFLIVAASVFLMVKALNTLTNLRLKKAKAEAKAEAK